MQRNPRDEKSEYERILENDLQARPRRGFAAMDREQLREISARGGRAAHRMGVAHEFDSQEARAAGRLSHSNRGGG